MFLNFDCKVPKTFNEISTLSKFKKIYFFNAYSYSF